MALRRVEVRLDDDTIKTLKKIKGKRSYTEVVTDLIKAAAAENPRDIKATLAKSLLALNRLLAQGEKTIVEDVVLSPVPSKILTVLSKESHKTKAEVIESLLYDQARQIATTPQPNVAQQLNGTSSALTQA